MNAKMNQNATIGEKFEQRFLQELQARFKMARTSRSTDHMFICDIVHDECLIELKSTRDNYKETTVETFTRICKHGLKDFKKNGRKKGLFFQIVEMLKFERSMVIAGTYKIEPNKLYNLWIRNPDQAWSNYTEYKIMTHWFQGSTYTRIPAREFWALADRSHSLRNFKGKLEDYADDQYKVFPDYSNHWWASHFTSALCQLNLGIPSDQIESLFDDSFKGSLQPNQRPQTWIEKEKQAQIEPVEVVVEPVEAVAERTDGYTYPIIEQDKWNNHKIFEPENLKKIEDGIRNQVRLRDLSLELGYSNVYLTGTITSNESYKSENWVTYKKWILNLMDEVDYNHKPTASIESIEEAQKQVRKYRTQVSNYEIKLEKQAKKHQEEISQIRQDLDQPNQNKLVITELKERLSSMNELHTKQRNEINELKAKLNSKEINQVDETTTLKLEAYQAEIKKLQTQLEESQAAFDKLIDEAVTMNLEIKDQKLEIEQLKASSSVIKDQQIIDSLLLLIEKLK